MKHHKQCLELVDLYRSYTCRDDGHKKHHGNFRIWDEENEAEVVFEEKNEEDGDVIFYLDGYQNWLSEMEDTPLQWLKSLKVVQEITLVHKGKVTPVKDLMICACGDIMAPFSYLRDSKSKKTLMEKLS